MMVVKVEESTGRITVFGPTIAESLRLYPFSLCLSILSKTTTALSTNKPNPRAKPDKVNIFRSILKRSMAMFKKSTFSYFMAPNFGERVRWPIKKTLKL